MKHTSRILAVLLALLLLAGLFPASAMAAGSVTVTALTVPEEGGTVTLSGSNVVNGLNGAQATYSVGASFTVTASAAAGYVFDGWYDVYGDKDYTANPLTLTAASDLTLNAMFSKVGEYAIYSEDLATSPGPHTKGTIDVSPTRYTYAQGTQLTLSASPAANYRLEAFEWGYGNASSTSVSWTRLSGNTMTMPAGDIWIRGVFRSTVSHAVNVVCDEGGTYSISPAGPYYDGTEITVTAIPDAAYQVKRISGSPAAYAWSGRVFEFIMSDKNETINIEFEKKPLVGGQFIPFPNAGGTVTGGDQDPTTGLVTVTATPNDNYFFVGWVDFEDGNKVLSRDPTYSFVPKAEFKMWAVFQKYLGSPDSGGTVSAQRNNATGEITLSAQEASGSFFAGWYWYNAMTQGTATAVSRDETWTFLPDPLPVTDALVGIFQPYAASSDAGGTVSAQRNNTTGEVTLSAAAASGYDFLGWYRYSEIIQGNAAPLSTSAVWTFLPEQPTRDIDTLVALFASNDGYEVRVASDIEHGSLTVVSGMYRYRYGETVTLAANPDEGYALMGFAVANIINGVIQKPVPLEGDSFTMPDNDVAVTAVFWPLYNIGLAADPSEGGTVSGGGSYIKGSSVTVTAAANDGYAFTGWTENGSVVSTEASYTFTAEDHRTLTASFAPLRTVTLTADPVEGGSVSGGGTYASGSSVTVTATAVSGYRFANWTENGSVVSTDASYTFTVTGDRALAAHFEASSDWVYTISDGKATVTGYNGGDRDVTIPSTLGGCPVTAIGDEAFERNDTIVRVTIPEGVTSIGAFAFHLSRVEFVDVPGSVTSIGANAFEGSHLMALDIPEGVESIEANLFNYCSNLSQVWIPGSVKSIEDRAFLDCYVLEDVWFSGTQAQWDQITKEDGWDSGAGAYTLHVLCELTLLADPAEGGTVKGGGQVFTASGTSVIAKANDGYTFAGWTENGSVVSTEATYSFDVSGARTLTAAFKTTASLVITATPAEAPLGGSLTITPTLPDGATGTIKYYLSDEISPDIFLDELGVGESLTLDLTYEPGDYLVKAHYSGDQHFTSADASVWIFESRLVPTLSVTAADTYIGGNVTITVNYPADADTSLTGISGAPAGLITIRIDGMDIDTVNGDNGVLVYEFPVGDSLAPGAHTVRAIFNGVGNYSSADASASFTVAQGAERDYTYETSGGKATITGYNGAGGDVTIPSELGGCPVTAIGYNAFKGNTAITSVTIPEGVTSIGETAFEQCTALTGVTIPESVTSIGDGAFMLCTALTSAAIPEGVTSIEAHMFDGCTALASVTIPEGVTSIGHDAFEQCTALTGVTIPESVTSIEYAAFYLCFSLKDIWFSGTQAQWNEIAKDDYWNENVGMEVGGYTLHYARLDVTLSASPASGGTVSGGGTYDTGASVTVAAAANEGYTFVNWTENGSPVSADASYTFTATGDRTLTAHFAEIWPYTVSDGKATITGYNGAGGDVTIPSELGGCPVTAIGDTVFNSCTALTGVTIPEGVTSIGGGAFNSCTALTDVTIPNSVTSIEFGAFYMCINLKDVWFSSTQAQWNEIAKGGSWDEYAGDNVGGYTLHYVRLGVTLSASPASGGTVSGGGTYDTGASVTVTATANDNYAFVNWTENGSPVSTDASYTFTATGDRTLTAHFERMTYTVKFVNEDGTELQSGEIAYGETPTYTGATPTKPATAQYTYTFAGWTPEITSVTGAATYTATYTETVNKYTVKFVNEDGTELQSGEIAYGEKPTKPADPTKEGHAFDGWFADEALTKPFDFTAPIEGETAIYPKWTPNDYRLKSVTGATADASHAWTKGSGVNVILTVALDVTPDNSFAHYVRTEIDGSAADASAREGSTIVTIKAAALQKLSVGVHTVTIVFDNGSVDIRLTVKSDPRSPATGDDRTTGLWAALTIFAVMGMGGSALIGKKRRCAGKH